MNQPSFTELSKVLISQLLVQFPEWQKYIEIAKSDFNNGKCSSLYVEIPSPTDENCFLSILDRDDCIEVGFYDGNSPGPAEKQIICQQGSEVKDVAESIDFIKEILEENFVVGREYLYWHFGNKPAPPQFIETTKLEEKRKNLVRVRSWNSKYNWELDK
jgi:hypothetical protein